VGLVLPVVVVALVVVVARMAAGTRAAAVRPVVPSSPELRAIARTTGRARLAGVAVGAVVGVVAAYQGGLGRGLLLAAPLFALCVLAGVLVGELRVGSPGGPVRQAALEVRRIRDYVPRALGSSVLAAGALLAVVLTLTTAAGSPDDMGRAGRDLFRRCSAVQAESAGPWPGSYYTLPLAIVVLCGLLAAGGVLTRVVRRPRHSDDLAVDEALRRSAAGSVTAAVGLLITVPLAGVSLVAAGALVRVSCHPTWWSVAASGLAAVAVASVTLAGACVSTLTTRGWRNVRVAVPADR
jgi:hypothetical protein